jgi:hypothetical protein
MGKSSIFVLWSTTITAALPILIGFSNTLQGFNLFFQNIDPQTNGLYDGYSPPHQLFLVLAPLRLGVAISIFLLSIEALILFLSAIAGEVGKH